MTRTSIALLFFCFPTYSILPQVILNMAEAQRCGARLSWVVRLGRSKVVVKLSLVSSYPLVNHYPSSRDKIARPYE